LSFGGD
jgi:hypothetical protein